MLCDWSLIAMRLLLDCPRLHRAQFEAREQEKHMRNEGHEYLGQRACRQFGSRTVLGTIAK